MPIGQMLILASLGWICYLLVTVIRKPSEWPVIAQLAPLFMFLWYAHCFDMSQVCWPNAFILAGITALLVIVLLSFLTIRMDRLLLGVNFFFILGGFAFAGNIDVILNLLDEYKGGFFLGSIVIVGLLTTLFSRAGFIGLESGDQNSISFASWILLGISIAAVVWSVLFAPSDLLWSAVVPFIIIRTARETLVDMVSRGRFVNQ